MEEKGKTKLSVSHIKAIEDMMKDMQYGSVTIIIQDGKIIQIDKTEKHGIRN